MQAELQNRIYADMQRFNKHPAVTTGKPVPIRTPNEVVNLRYMGCTFQMARVSPLQVWYTAIDTSARQWSVGCGR